MNILIVKLSAIGDVIHALPVAHALKTGFPGCKITWIVEKPAMELVQANAYIDEVILFDKPRCKTWNGLRQYATGFISDLRSHKFDLSIDLQGLFKSAIISRLSGVTNRLVYCNARELSDWMGKKVCGPNQRGHIVEQYLDVVRYLGVQVGEAEFGLSISDEIAAQAAAIAAQAQLDLEQDYIVLAPGANWPNKRWPTKHFARLADQLFNEGIIPVLIGGPGDSILAQDITKQSANPSVDLTGKTSLLELAYLIRNSKLIIGGDTGPVHLAVALNTPAVMVMGPTDPARNRPYGECNAVLLSTHECAGCWQRKCRYNRDCLEIIDPNAVYQAVISLLKEIPVNNISFYH
jgi:heptosyltransferase-1